MFKEKEYQFKGRYYNIAYIDPSPYHASWFTFEDESSVRDAQWSISFNECVFDVGAAYGSYSLTALAVGASKVYAWSPQGEVGLPAEREFFRESLKLNGWEDKCVIYDSGVYDKAGWLNALTQEFSIAEPTEFNNDIIKVDQLDLWYENVFLKTDKKENHSGFWLKLDVEGAEVEVLKSSSKLIKDLKPRITLENHVFKRATIEQEVRDVLVGYGYREIMTTPYHSVSHSLYIPNVL